MNVLVHRLEHVLAHLKEERADHTQHAVVQIDVRLVAHEHQRLLEVPADSTLVSLLAEEHKAVEECLPTVTNNKHTTSRCCLKSRILKANASTEDLTQLGILGSAR